MDDGWDEYCYILYVYAYIIVISIVNNIVINKGILT